MIRPCLYNHMMYFEHIPLFPMILHTYTQF